MSENDVLENPEASPVKAETSGSDVITAKATVKKTDGDGTDFLGTVGSGAIGVTKSSKSKTTTRLVESKREKEPTVAIYSSKNVIWEGVGKVSRGYNIVTQAASTKWLTRGHVREATPEEVAREYGN